MVKNNFSFSKLKKNQVKELINNLEHIYGISLKNLYDSHFYVTPKGKTYISNINLNENEFKKINSIGLYFGTFHDNERFRLSLEGTHIVGLPKYNYILIKDKKTFESYLSGENLFLDEIEKIETFENPNFYIVVYKDKTLGSVSVKNKEILSYIPKSRSIDFNKIF